MDNASTDKTSTYTEEDWKRITARAVEIHKKVAENMDKGAAAPEVQNLIAQLRQHITEDICDCTPEILKMIGNIYVSDNRFTVKVDKFRPGFAFFLQEALHIYCNKSKISIKYYNHILSVCDLHSTRFVYIFISIV